MSDGVANVDATDPFAILESAGDYDDSNPLRLITIGVGIENFNDFLLEQLAQHGNGWYRYLSDTMQARSTFTRENWLALSIPFADADPRSGHLGPRRGELVAHRRLRKPRNLRRVLHRGSQGVCGNTRRRRHHRLLRVGTEGPMVYRSPHPGRRGNPLGDPIQSEESNRQHSGITSHNFDFNFADPLLRMGAVVALSSDRYSSLPYPDSSSPTVHQDLLYLLDQFHSLDANLNHLGAYQDLGLLLNHITRNSRQVTRPSGYTR